MGTKEKARELYHMFRGFNSESKEINHNTALQCAELCINELINECAFDYQIEYWQEVMAELKKIRV